MSVITVSILVLIVLSILSAILKLTNFLRMAKIFNRLPGLKSCPIVGEFPFLLQHLKYGYPFTIVLQQSLLGLMTMFPKESIIRLWVGLLPYSIIYGANSAEVILSSPKEINKSREYRFFHTWLRFGLLTSSGSKWKTRRRMLTPSFHFKILKDSFIVMNEQSLNLVKHLSKQLEKESVDILHFITMCTLDIICETAMGVSIDAQTNSDSDYIKSLHIMTDIAILRAMNPFYWSEFLFGMTSKGKQYNQALKVVHSFTKRVITKGLTEKSNSKDLDYEELEIAPKKKLAFLDLLIEEHRANPLFTESDIQEEVDTFMFEGHDTTAVGTSWCIYLLGLHPDIQEEAYNEVVRVIGDSKDNVVTEEELKDLKYLDCIIKESQRMFPSVPLIGRELKDDMIIDKKVLPKGSTVLVFISALHRNPEYFRNPNAFDPSRFTLENSSGRHPFAFIPFSAGPRNCIGQKFAFNEEKIVMVNLIRNFSWVSLDPLDKLTYAPHMVSRPVPGHRIKLFKRT